MVAENLNCDFCIWVSPCEKQLNLNLKIGSRLCTPTSFWTCLVRELSFSKKFRPCYVKGGVLTCDTGGAELLLALHPAARALRLFPSCEEESESFPVPSRISILRCIVQYNSGINLAPLNPILHQLCLLVDDLFTKQSSFLRWFHKVFLINPSPRPAVPFPLHSC